MNRNTDECKFCFYDQIYKDFKIGRDQIEYRVVVLSSCNLDKDQLKYSDKNEILFSHNVTETHKDYVEANWKGLPLASKDYKNTPLTIFIQNPKMDAYFSWMSLKSLTITTNTKRPVSIFSFQIWKESIGVFKML